jgi:hypothetical protein
LFKTCSGKSPGYAGNDILKVSVFEIPIDNMGENVCGKSHIIKTSTAVVVRVISDQNENKLPVVAVRILGC